MGQKTTQSSVITRRALGQLVLGTAGVAGAAALGRWSVTVTKPTPVTGDPVALPRADRRVANLVGAERKLEGAGFPVRRPFPIAAMDQVDPFVLLDEFGPVDWAPGKALGAPDHPHRGFEAVSYLLQGRNNHADSMGNRGELGPGDVQWMTTGGGIVHAEMPHDEILRDGGRMHGFQIWVNLPARLKMTAPRYQEVKSARFPVATTPDGLARVRVVAGQALGVAARIDTLTPIVYQHWTLMPGAEVVQPVAADHNACVYVFGGRCEIGSEATPVGDGQLAIVGPGEALRLAMSRDASAHKAELLLLAGVPHREPVARMGPFVMNTQAELRQAWVDYRDGRMGRIPG